VAIKDIVTAGFGSFSETKFIPTRGFSSGAVVVLYTRQMYATQGYWVPCAKSPKRAWVGGAKDIKG
jgi:hypothetical protein